MELSLLLAPLVGALVTGLTWRWIGEAAALWTGAVFAVLAALLSGLLLFFYDGTPDIVLIARFIETGSLSTDWAVLVDGLSLSFALLATGLGAGVHLYLVLGTGDVNYRDGETHRARSSAYLSLLVFAALLFFFASDVAQLLAGWGGIGAAIYLLIGLYHRKPAATAAAIKSALIDRIGDGMVLLAAAVLFVATDSLSFDVVFSSGASLGAQSPFGGSLADMAGIFLMVAAFTKAGQILFHGWLIDGTSAPATALALAVPISIGAGLYLVLRMGPVAEMSSLAPPLGATIGVASVIFGAAASLGQAEIKRSLAYGAMSGAGALLAVVSLAPTPSAGPLLGVLLGLGLLFLVASGVIRATGGAQKLWHYGGLRNVVPVLFWGSALAVLAYLAGLSLLVASIGAGSGLAFLVYLAPLLAGIALGRVVLFTFFGCPRTEADAKGSSKAEARGPGLAVLPVLGLGAGAVLPLIWAIGGAGVTALLLFISALAGLGLAWWAIGPNIERAKSLTASMGGLGLWAREGFRIDRTLESGATGASSGLATAFWDRGEQRVEGTGLGAAATALLPTLGRMEAGAKSGFRLTFLVALGLSAAVFLVWALAIGGGQ
ncbi:MAG: proton-conducting transporter membrane subunit [Pseudomonadota bacterium]